MGTLLLRDVPLREIPVVEPQTALDEALRLMEEEPLKTVVLVGDEMYMGVFNADLVDSGLIPRGADRSTIPVGPYVQASRAEGSPSMTAEQALALMNRRSIDVLPVVSGVRYLGVVTRADLEKVTENRGQVTGG